METISITNTRMRETEGEQLGTCRNGGVVLVPFPLQGHISPMLDLGNVLQSKGFSITIAHTIFNAPTHNDFNFLPISDNLSNPNTSPGNLIGLVEAINANCEAPFRKSLAQMMENREPHHRIVCIIYDTLMHFAEAVATEMNLPTFILRTAGASALLSFDSIPRLRAEGYIPSQDSMLQDLVPGLYPLRFKDLSLSNFGNLEDVIQMIVTARNTRSSSAIIWNTIDHLENSSLSQLQQYYQLPFFPIGPLHKMAPPSSTSLLEEDTSCLTWLDKQAPGSVIYVSLGSLATIDEKELSETAWGLANSNLPFLWVVRPGSVHGSKWVEHLPQGYKEKIGERGHIVKWAPQKDVLAHRAVGGFWSHCGWNSTLESISEGVPIICMPSFADQKVNARYLSQVWRVGLQLDHELERGEIERAIRRLMVDKEGEEMRQRAIDMKEKVEICLSKDGSSYNSLNELIDFILSLQLPK